MGAQPDTSTSAPEVRHGIRQILAPIFVAKFLATYLASAHSVDSTRSASLPDASDIRGPAAVAHENTVLRQIVTQIPFNELNTLIAKHHADKGIRRLDTQTLTLVLIFAQLSGARSLRDIEALLQSQSARRYHSG